MIFTTEVGNPGESFMFFFLGWGWQPRFEVKSFFQLHFLTGAANPGCEIRSFLKLGVAGVANHGQAVMAEHISPRSDYHQYKLNSNFQQHNKYIYIITRFLKT